MIIRWNLKIYRIMISLLEIEIIFLVNLITFWNRCFTLFKSLLRCREQSRYLRTNKIHGVKRRSHDRRLQRLQMLVSGGVYRGYRCPHRKFRPQQPRLLPLFFFLSFSFFSLHSAIPPPYSHSFSSRPDELASAKRFVASTEYVLWRKLYEGRARRQSYILTVHTGRIPDVNTYNRHKVQTSAPWPSIRSCCRELPC